MKKFILLFVIALLPVFGFGQVDLVKWQSEDLSATGSSADVSLLNCTMSVGTGNITTATWSLPKFLVNIGANPGANPTSSQYIQFVITPASGKQLTLSQFNFRYRATGDQSLVVRYSKDPNFLSYSTLFSDTYGTAWEYSPSEVYFNNSINPVLPTEKVYVRIYVYGTNQGNLIIQRTNGSSPTIIGTATSTIPPVLTAVNDTATVNKNTATDISVLTNDAQGSAPINAVQIVSQPTNTGGTVSINPNNTVHYVPATGFTGPTSFTYKINNGIDPESTATVNINVVIPAPSGPLCGTYVIGSTPQTEYYQFTTITQAVSYLNTNGVSCPVTFLLNDAAYTSSTETFPITINQFTGTSAANTLTIKPNAGKTVSVSGSMNGGAVIALNGADNIIIDGNNGTGDKNLTIYNNFNVSNSYANRAAIWMYGGATNNIIRNAIVRLNILGTTVGTFSVGVLSGSSTFGNAENNSNNIVFNNTFTDVKQAIFVYGSDTSNSNWTITNNVIGSASDSTKPFLGVYVNNINNYTISNNTINGVKRPASLGGTGVSTSFSAIFANSASNGTISNNQILNIENASGNSDGYAVYVKGNTTVISNNTISDVNSNSTNSGSFGAFIDGNNAIIFNNKISNVFCSEAKLTTGIYLKGNTQLIYNNFVNEAKSTGGGDPTTQDGSGIFIDSGSDIKLYYNTVRLSLNQATGTSSALFIKGGSQLDIRNNIFVNAQTGGVKRYAMFSYATSFINLDFNNYTSSQYVAFVGSNPGYEGAANPEYKVTLANWQTLNNTYNQNSISINPNFVSTTTMDLHLATDEAPNDVLIGTPISGITSDIDGHVRNTTAPTMGADEFRKCSSAGTSVYSGTNWDVSPTDTAATINSDFPLDSDLVLCSLTVGAGKKVTIASGKTLTVYGNVVVEAGGKIVVESDGALIQVNDDAKYYDNGVKNSFTAKRDTQLVYRYDFTYWSSPLADTDLTVTDPAWKFTLKKLSPQTLFNKYHMWDEAGQAWQVNTNGTEVMKPGRGYIVRAPQTFNIQGNGAPSTHTASFVGTPNTGTITYSNVRGSTAQDSNWNLLGNPYPSAINVKEFLLENQAVLDGTIYLWTHNTNLTQNANSGTYTYNPSDYASYNFSGSVATAPGTGEDAENSGVNNMTPNEFLSSGQGFFVKGKIGAAANSTVTFRNSMREKTAVNQFFRPGPSEPVNNWTTTGQHRIWLNLTGATNAFNQTLVGYIEGATDDLDWGFDGDHFGGNQVTLYSLIDTKRLTIQGRALPFNDQDEVPLGYKTTLTGTLKVAIDHFDGLFEGQDIYLEDKTLNIVHNLKEAEYTFTTIPGTFNDRFVLRYVPQAQLGTDNPTVDANSMVIFRDGSQINIKSNEQTIEHVTVYDLLGKVIFDKGNINAQSFSTAQLNVSNQVVIVKVITDTKAEVVKKVIMN